MEPITVVRHAGAQVAELNVGTTSPASGCAAGIQMTRRSRPHVSADARRRFPDGDPLSESINAYLCRRQAEQLPVRERPGRSPHRKRGSGRPTRAIAALAILIASLVLFLVV